MAKHIGESLKRKLEGRRKQFQRRTAVKRPHGAVVGSCLVHSKLCSKIGNEVEAVVTVELFLIFAVMVAFDFIVVSWCIGADVVTERERSSKGFKQCLEVSFGVREAVSKFKLVDKYIIV